MEEHGRPVGDELLGEANRFTDRRVGVVRAAEHRRGPGFADRGLDHFATEDGITRMRSKRRPGLSPHLP